MPNRKKVVGKIVAIAVCVHMAPMQMLPTLAQSADNVPTAGATGNATYNLIQAGSLEGQGLNVGAGSTYVIDFANNPNGVNLSGNLQNNGTIYVVSTNSSLTSASFFAQNIFNNQGALLTTILPPSGLAGLNFTVVGLNLSLNAVNNIVNAGTISSAGDLFMSAGNSIVNQLPTSVAGVNPVIQAMQNLNMITPNLMNAGEISAQAGLLNITSANILNSGILQALANNLNVQNMIGENLNINNTLGTIFANRNLDFNSLNSVLADLTIGGGTIAGKEISLTSDGKVTAQLNQVLGPISVKACALVLGSETGDLSIHELNLSGDPLIYSSHDLDLSGLFVNGATFATYGGDFVALAGGNILASTAPEGATINAQSATNAGGRIELAAGVDFQVNNANSTSFIPGKDYSITGTSSTGGDVSLANVSLITNNSPISVTARGACQNEGRIEIENVTICCSKGENGTQNSTFQASHPSISLHASSDITPGNLTNICGAIDVTSEFGDVTLPLHKNINAFNGGVDISAGRDVILEGDNSVIGVGGDVNVHASDDILISQSDLSAFEKGVDSANLRLTAGHNINSSGQSNFLATGGGIALTSVLGSIESGANDTFQSSPGATSNGDICFSAPLGHVRLGQSNQISAESGDVSMLSLSSTDIGSETTINAFRSAGHGGNITARSLFGHLNLSDSVHLSAVGGDLELDGRYGLSTGKNANLIAFHANSAGGDVSMNSAVGDINLGSANLVEASVNGDVMIQAANGEISTGANTRIRAFGQSGAGRISLTAEEETIGNSNELSAQRDLTIRATSRGIKTGEGVSLLTTGNGDLTLQSDRDSVTVGANNSIEANGGDVSISATNLPWRSGNVSVGENTSIQAHRSHSEGGSVKIEALNGNVIVSNQDEFNADGGELSLAASAIALGSENVLNAFGSNGTNGDVNLLASNGAITGGSENSFNAVSGNLSLQAQSINMGDATKIVAFSCLSGYLKAA